MWTLQRKLSDKHQGPDPIRNFEELSTLDSQVELSFDHQRDTFQNLVGGRNHLAAEKIIHLTFKTEKAMTKNDALLALKRKHLEGAIIGKLEFANGIGTL